MVQNWKILKHYRLCDLLEESHLFSELFSWGSLVCVESMLGALTVTVRLGDTTLPTQCQILNKSLQIGFEVCPQDNVWCPYVCHIQILEVVLFRFLY